MQREVPTEAKCSSRLSCYCKFIERICARHDFSSPTVHSDICDAPLGPLISILGCQADEVLELPILHVATIHLRSASSVGQFPSSKCMVLTASAVVAAAPAAEPLLKNNNAMIVPNLIGDLVPQQWYFSMSSGPQTPPPFGRWRVNQGQP